MTGTPGEQQQGQPEHREQEGHALDRFFGWLRGLGIHRNTDDKWLAGVCSGVANRLGVDPVLVRGALLLLVIFGGFGLTLYLLAWALLPDRHDHIVAEGGIRHGEGWGIALLVVIAIAIFSDLAGRWWIWTIILPTLLLGWVFKSSKAGKTPEQMGEEASQLANTVASRVEAWGAGIPAAYAGSSPQAAAPVSPSSPGAFGHGGPAPHGMGPGRTGTVTPPAPRVIQQRRRNAGFLGLLLTAGLALAAYGVGTQAATGMSSTASPHVFGLGAALAAAGLALVLIGLLGRRAGFTGFVATALAVAAVLGTTPSPEAVQGGFGERHWSPTATAAAGPYRLAAGEATLDLTGAAGGSTVEVSVGMGELVIRVPPTAKVAVNPQLNAGDVTVKKADGTKQKYDSDELPASLQVGSGATTVTVNARVGMGDITIEER
jgi:phage shock protein PspC (stress-responsive transcriptional regulator)